MLNAKAARAKGATILTRTRVVACHSEDGIWRIEIDDASGRREVRARALVNAAGPWVDKIDGLSAAPGRMSNRGHVRLIKGSHIVVPRIAGANDAYLMQNADKRVVFVLPFEERFTIIGTTDLSFTGEPAAVTASADEEQYLLDLAGHFFKRPLKASDVVWRYSGVRPLFDDASDNPSAVTRDYHLSLNAPAGGAPRLSVYGGKVTTYRRLAEEALAHLAPHLGRTLGPTWTATAPLPGGDLPGGAIKPFVADLQRRYPVFEPLHLERLAHRHGTLIFDVLGDAKTPADLGHALGFGLFEREVRYMKCDEWAAEPADILWRRTKLGLHALAESTPDERQRLEDSIALLL